MISNKFDFKRALFVFKHQDEIRKREKYLLRPDALNAKQALDRTIRHREERLKARGEE